MKPSCHTGDKTPDVPQSDDQFKVWAYAIRQGLEVKLSRSTLPGGPGITLLSVPALGIWNQRPFDYDLHMYARSIHE